jgi:hypothetical protein
MKMKNSRSCAMTDGFVAFKANRIRWTAAVGFAALAASARCHSVPRQITAPISQMTRYEKHNATTRNAAFILYLSVMIPR